MGTLCACCWGALHAGMLAVFWSTSLFIEIGAVYLAQSGQITPQLSRALLLGLKVSE